MDKKIILIEDDFLIGDIYRRQLAHAGFTVDLETSGLTGFEKIQQNKYDLVLLDVMLPGMDGVGVLRKLRGDEATKQIPVIMLSNLAQDSIVQEVQQLKVHAYLVKDQLLPNQLVEEVEKLFDSLV